MKVIDEKDHDLEASDQEMNSVGYCAVLYAGLALAWMFSMITYALLF